MYECHGTVHLRAAEMVTFRLGMFYHSATKNEKIDKNNPKVEEQLSSSDRQKWMECVSSQRTLREMFKSGILPRKEI